MGWTWRETRTRLRTGSHTGLPDEVDRRWLGRPVNRKSEGMAIHSNSRRDIQRKRALFTSDGPDSTTFGSDIPVGYADRPPGGRGLWSTDTQKTQGWGWDSETILPEAAAERCRRLPHGARASKEADSGGRPSASATVGVHINASSEILQKIKLGTVPWGVWSHRKFERTSIPLSVRGAYIATTAPYLNDLYGVFSTIYCFNVIQFGYNDIMEVNPFSKITKTKRFRMCICGLGIWSINPAH